MEAVVSTWGLEKTVARRFRGRYEACPRKVPRDCRVDTPGKGGRSDHRWRRRQSSSARKPAARMAGRRTEGIPLPSASPVTVPFPVVAVVLPVPTVPETVAVTLAVALPVPRGVEVVGQVAGGPVELVVADVGVGLGVGDELVGSGGRIPPLVVVVGVVVPADVPVVPVGHVDWAGLVAVWLRPGAARAAATMRPRTRKEAATRAGPLRSRRVAGILDSLDMVFRTLVTAAMKKVHRPPVDIFQSPEDCSEETAGSADPITKRNHRPRGRPPSLEAI